MKKIIILFASAALIFSSCGGGGTTSLKTEADSVAYLFGVQCGEYVFAQDSTVDMNIVMKGAKDAFSKKITPEQKEELFAFLREVYSVRKPARAKEEGVKFLAEAEKKANVKKTESGLLYEIVEAGSDVKAINNYDTVSVIYAGTLKTGKEFDSSRGDTVTFALNQVIPGWSEGVKLVGKGGKVKLIIPSELAYGEQGAGQVIGPNEPILFDVTLVDVKPGVAPVTETPAK